MWIPVSQHMWRPSYPSLTIPCCLSPTGKCPRSLQYESLHIHHKWIPAYPSPDPFLPLKCKYLFTYHIITIQYPSITCKCLLIHHMWIPAYPSPDPCLSIKCESLFTRSIITVQCHPPHENLCLSITSESLPTQQMIPVYLLHVILWLQYLRHVSSCLSFTFESLPLLHMITVHPSHVNLRLFITRESLTLTPHHIIPVHPQESLTTVSTICESLPILHIWILVSTSHVNPYLSVTCVNLCISEYITCESQSNNAHPNPFLYVTCRSLPYLSHLWIPVYASNVNTCLSFKCESCLSFTRESLPILHIGIPDYPSHVNPCLFFTCESLHFPHLWIPAFSSLVNPCLSFSWESLPILHMWNTVNP